VAGRGPRRLRQPAGLVTCHGRDPAGRPHRSRNTAAATEGALGRPGSGFPRTDGFRRAGDGHAGPGAARAGRHPRRARP
jgi:hypothetical protein